MKTALMCGLTVALCMVAQAQGPVPQRPVPPGPHPGSAGPARTGMLSKRTPDGRAMRGNRRAEERMSETEMKLERISQLEEKGRKAMPQLAVFIAEPEEEVADAAFTAWSMQLDQMDGSRRAYAIIEAAKALQSVGYNGQPDWRGVPLTPMYGQPRPDFQRR